MGKDSPSPPPAPDYAGAAREQGAANVDTARIQGRINNPNIYGPLGNQLVTFGENDQPTMTQTLTPDSMATLQAQQRVQRGLANLGEQGISTAQRIMGTPFQPRGSNFNAQSGLPNAQQGLPSGGDFKGGMPPSTPGYSFQSTSNNAFPDLQTSLGNQGQIDRGPNAGMFGIQQGGVQGPNLQSSLGRSGRINQGPSGGQFGYAQQNLPGPELQNRIDTSGVAGMPVNAGMTGQQAIMARLAPQLERQQKSNAQTLANQGLVSGGEAYTNAMRDQAMQQNDLLSQAALQGINLDLSANAQGFGQAQAQGQFGNQAQLAEFGAGLQNAQLYNQGIQQNFGNALQAQQAQNAAQAQQFGQQVQSGQFGNQAQLASFGANLQNQQAQNQAAAQNFAQAQAAQQGQNAAQNQQYNQALQSAQFGNTAQQQSLAQQLQLRNQPLNEITGLMSGSQIQMPQFQGYQGSNIAPPPIMAAAQAQNQANMNNYGIQSANANAQNAGLYGLAQTGGMMYAMSDSRLKTNIVRIGDHPLGIGVYEYDIDGRRDVGVMAQEVLVVKPEAVLTHPSGYYMVNYAAL